MKRIYAGIGALALVGGLAACGSSSGGGGSSGSAAPVTIASWYNTIGLPEINTVNQDIQTVSNDGNYDIDPMSDEEQAVTDAQAGLANLPPIDAADWKGWLNNVILVEQDAEQSPYMTAAEEQASADAGQDSQAFAAAVATATGSGSPSADSGSGAPAANAQATDPAGNTCPSLDSAGYCPGDDPATPAASAPTPTVTQTPTAATTDPWTVISQYYALIRQL